MLFVTTATLVVQLVVDVLGACCSIAAVDDN